MAPYVIRQGDFLALLAYRLGFDADSVWNDPSNDDLRKIREDLNILAPADVLHIPDPDEQPQWRPLTTGSENTFVADVPSVTIALAFVSGDDATAYANRGFTVVELPDLTGLTTDGDGKASIPVPAIQPSLTVVFTDTGEQFEFSVGCLNPLNTLSGAMQRLQNLGYIDDGLDVASLETQDQIAYIRAGLRALREDTSSPATDPDDNGGIDDLGTLSSDASDMLKQAYGC